MGMVTPQFTQMAPFFGQVMELEGIRGEPGIAGFRLGDQTQMEIYAPGADEGFHDFFAPGPVIGFEVDNVDSARSEMEAAGIEFIGPIQREGNACWNHFRAPDGTVFEIVSYGPAEEQEGQTNRQTFEHYAEAICCAPFST